MLTPSSYYYYVSFPTYVAFIETENKITTSTTLVDATRVYKLFTIETDANVFENFKLRVFDKDLLEDYPLDDVNGTYLLNISNCSDVIGISKTPDYKLISEEEIYQIKEKLKTKN